MGSRKVAADGELFAFRQRPQIPSLIFMNNYWWLKGLVNSAFSGLIGLLIGYGLNSAAAGIGIWILAYQILILDEKVERLLTKKTDL